MWLLFGLLINNLKKINKMTALEKNTAIFIKKFLLLANRKNNNFKKIEKLES